MRIGWNNLYECDFNEIVLSSLQSREGSFMLTGYQSNGQNRVYDIFLKKLSPDGAVEWNRVINLEANSQCYAITETAEGNILMAGIIGNLRKFALLICAEPNGEVIWTRVFGGEGNNFISSVIEAEDGSIFLGGSTESDNLEFWLIKVNREGEIVWQRTYAADDNNRDHWCYGMISTNDNCLIMFGSVNFDYAMGFVIKINRNGEVIWRQVFPGNGNHCNFYDGVQNADGGFAFVGEEYVNGEFYHFLVGVNEEGEIELESTFDDDAQYPGVDVAILRTDNNGYLIATTRNINGTSRAILRQLNAEGNELWNLEPGESSHTLQSMINTDDGILLSGYSYVEEHGFTNTWAAFLDSEGGLSSRNIALTRGWNLVSTNIQPQDEDIPTITEPLVEAGQLDLMKNGFGQFYAPAAGFNSIPGWYASQGYWMRLAEPAVLRVSGESMLADDPIELTRGWNLISYYPRRAVEAPVALSGIVDHLLIAKDGFGNFYVPAWGFNNMAPLQEGRGYQLKVDEDIELVYRTGQVQSVANPNNIEVTKFNQTHNTGNNMSLLLLTDKSLEGFVKVFASNRQVGLGYAQDGFCGIAVWGDDPTTDEIDGAREGEELQIERCKQQSIVYTTDGFEVMDIQSGLETIPTRFELTSVYPNPFNSTTQISYSLPEMSDLSIRVFDISGRLVATLVKGEQDAGHFSIIWDAKDMSAGVFLVKMESTSFSATRKVVLVK